jgi:hypothetical protein
MSCLSFSTSCSCQTAPYSLWSAAIFPVFPDPTASASFALTLIAVIAGPASGHVEATGASGWASMEDVLVRKDIAATIALQRGAVAEA